MKLPLYKYGEKKVVIWSREWETSSTFFGHVEESRVRYSILHDSGELGDFRQITCLACDFPKHFQPQDKQVEVGWNRLV